jgi:hypothetical protein
MSTIPVHLAVEDELSEAVLRRMLLHLNRGYHVGTTYRRGGFGYLRRTVRGWNRAAAGTPFIILTDLDQYACPRALIEEWLPEPRQSNLLFRVAVREVESWLIADAENLSKHLSVHRKWMPEQPDALTDPKAALVDVARRSRSSDLRNRIVPRPGSTAKQGPDYNGCLVAFVLTTWNIDAARAVSPSLARTVKKLSEFTPTWHR